MASRSVPPCTPVSDCSFRARRRPRCSPAGLAPPSRSGRPRAVVASRSTASPDEEDDVRVTTHRVKRGESLYAIANAYDVSVADLRAWNRMKGTHLDVGDKLTIRVTRTRAAQ